MKRLLKDNIFLVLLIIATGSFCILALAYTFNRSLSSLGSMLMMGVLLIEALTLYVLTHLQKKIDRSDKINLDMHNLILNEVCRNRSDRHIDSLKSARKDE